MSSQITTKNVAHSIRSAPDGGRISQDGFERALGLIRRPELGALVAALSVYAFFAVTAGNRGFLTIAGTASWLNTAAELGVVAVPIAILLIAGEFDLSVGGLVGSSSMIVATCTTLFHWPLELSILVTLAFGAIVGLVNAAIRLRTGLPSFIVTLAMLLAILGASLGVSRALTGTTIVSLNPSGAALVIFGTKWGPFSVSVAWWVVITACAAWVMGKTAFGNWVLATGGDIESARTAGVPTDLVKVVLFMATAVGACLIGVLEAVQFKGGDVSRGQAFIFNSMVASIVGGVLLSGGYGSAWGVFLGTATYGIISLGLFYTGWSTEYLQLFLGVLLLLAVLANNYFRKLALRA